MHPVPIQRICILRRSNPRSEMTRVLRMFRSPGGGAAGRLGGWAAGRLGSLTHGMDLVLSTSMVCLAKHDGAEPRVGHTTGFGAPFLWTIRDARQARSGGNKEHRSQEGPTLLDTFLLPTRSSREVRIRVPTCFCLF